MKKYVNSEDESSALQRDFDHGQRFIALGRLEVDCAEDSNRSELFEEKLGSLSCFS